MICNWMYWELGNIGAGNAATSLSSMLNRPGNTVPTVRIPIKGVTTELGGPENLIIAHFDT